MLGAGFIGCEVAATVRGLGLDVVLVDAAARPLERAAGPVVAPFVADLHRNRGVDLRVGVGVRDLDLVGATSGGVCLDDGTRLDADLAVVGFGVNRTPSGSTTAGC